jgi:hypothetical protein
MFTEQGNLQAVGLQSTYLAERSIWLGDFTKAGTLADQAWELARESRWCQRTDIGRCAPGILTLSALYRD